MDDAANAVVLDPLFRGCYPERVLKRLGRFLPRGFEKDLAEMRNPGTFVGINYYTRNRYRYSFFVPFVHAVEFVDPKAPRSGQWEIYPPGIYKALIRLKDRYGNLPCVIPRTAILPRISPAVIRSMIPNASPIFRITLPWSAGP